MPSEDFSALPKGHSRGTIAEAHLVPGIINLHSGSIVGDGNEAKETIRKFPASCVIVFAAGVSRDGTLFSFEDKVVPIKREMLKKGRDGKCRILIVCHDSKIDHVSLHAFGSLKDLSKTQVTLLTNKPTWESRTNGNGGNARFIEAIKDLQQICHVEVCDIEKGKER